MPRAVYGIHKVMLHTDWLDVPVLMDAAAASIVLGLKYETVRKAMQEGRLPAEKVMGTQWRIRKDKLMAHLGYADWEIERYGFGMPTPAKGRGFNPVIQDDFSTALKRKDDYPSVSPAADTSPDKGRQENAALYNGPRAGGVVDLNEMEVMAG